MKALSLFSLLVLAAATVQAAPAIRANELTEEALKAVATDKQKASLERHAEAVKKAEKEREDAIKEAKELTTRNNNGMKKTIQKRQLNTMLPPCEREPEAPRDDEKYFIRY